MPMGGGRWRAMTDKEDDKKGKEPKDPGFYGSESGGKEAMEELWETTVDRSGKVIRKPKKKE